jgi:hypothetical protein
MPSTTVKAHPRKGTKGVKQHSRTITSAKRVPHIMTNDEKAQNLHALYVYTGENISGRNYWGSLKEMGLLEEKYYGKVWVEGYKGFPSKYGYYAKKAQIDSFYVYPDTKLTRNQVKSFLRKNMTYKTTNLMDLAEKMLLVEQRKESIKTGVSRDKAWDQYTSSIDEFVKIRDKPKIRIKKLRKMIKKT